MNFDDMQFSVTAVQWLIMIAIGIYAWMVGRAAATNKEVVALRERIVKLEADMQNMPSQAALHELIAKLERLAAHSDHTNTQLGALQSSVNRINDFLLKQR